VAPHDAFDIVLIALFGLAPLILLLLLYVPAPYGRHARGGWGPTMPTRWAWILMESPAVLAFLGFYLAGAHALELVPLALLAAWMLHRTFVYPWSLRLSEDRRTPVSVVAMALCFNTANAYVNATWLSSRGSYPTSWLTDPRFVLGMLLFLAGYGINRWADAVLRKLRRPGEDRHVVPRGGLYELVSCPNYLGESLEWLGWALACWSLAGLSFAAFTWANLLPRAVAHHRWYRRSFPDYPPRRRAFLPYLL
jgi:3-oxo-5-alpha-steroid 4-dehydrogenase 1